MAATLANVGRDPGLRPRCNSVSTRVDNGKGGSDPETRPRCNLSSRLDNGTAVEVTPVEAKVQQKVCLRPLFVPTIRSPPRYPAYKAKVQQSKSHRAILIPVRATSSTWGASNANVSNACRPDAWREPTAHKSVVGYK